MACRAGIKIFIKWTCGRCVKTQRPFGGFMKKKKSIRQVVTAVILGILIPLNILGICAYKMIYNYVSDTLLQTQREALNHYIVQLEMGLKSTQSYVLQFLYEREWGNLMGERGELNYELDKVQLKKELYWKIAEEYLGNGDILWCNLKNTGEIVWSYQNIPYQDTLPIKEWVLDAEDDLWSLQKIGDVEYLYLSNENAIMRMGVLIRKDSLTSEWNSDSNSVLTIENDESAETTEKTEDGYILRLPLKEDGLTAALFVPEEYITQAMPIQVVVLLVYAVAGCSMAVLLVILLNQILASPLEQMAETIRRIKNGEKNLRLAENSKITEMDAVQVSFNNLMNQTYDLEMKNLEMEVENQKAQLMNLQLQINPHLLLNTLNTIYGLAEIEEYKTIQDFTMNLVKYFRYSLKQSDELVSLKQELDFVKCYVEVQKIRYPDSFYVLYNYESDILEEKIPPLLIENFAENSIKYSLGMKIVEVVVSARIEDEYLCISVCDDGVGMDEDLVNTLMQGKTYEKDGETHVGIYNCMRRLKLFYGDRAQITITSKAGEGTQVFMKLPRVEEKDESITG